MCAFKVSFIPQSAGLLWPASPLESRTAGVVCSGSTRCNCVRVRCSRTLTFCCVLCWSMCWSTAISPVLPPPPPTSPPPPPPPKKKEKKRRVCVLVLCLDMALAKIFLFTAKLKSSRTTLISAVYLLKYRELKSTRLSASTGSYGNYRLSSRLRYVADCRLESK